MELVRKPARIYWVEAQTLTVGGSVSDLLLMMGNGIEAVPIRGIDNGLDWKVT